MKQEYEDLDKKFEEELVKFQDKKKKIDEEKKIKLENENNEFKKILKKDEILIHRNFFYQKFKYTIEKNISNLKKEIFLPSLKKNLDKLNLNSKNFEKEFSENNVEELYNKVNNYFQKKNENEILLINTQKEINEKKDEVYMLLKKYNDIQNLINKFKGINISDKNSIEEIFNSEMMKEFFGEEECNKFIEIFNKCIFYDDLYKNQKFLYFELNEIFEKFINEIGGAKNTFLKYYDYHQLYSKYNNIKNKDKIKFEIKAQNEVFINYMKVFEKFLYGLYVFFNEQITKKIIEIKDISKQRQITLYKKNAELISNKKNNDNIKINPIEDLMEFDNRKSNNNNNSSNVLTEVLKNLKGNLTFVNNQDYINLDDLKNENENIKKKEKKEKEEKKKILVKNSIERIKNYQKKIEDLQTEEKKQKEMMIENSKLKKENEDFQKIIDDLKKQCQEKDELINQNKKIVNELQKNIKENEQKNIMKESIQKKKEEEEKKEEKKEEEKKEEEKKEEKKEEEKKEEKKELFNIFNLNAQNQNKKIELFTNNQNTNNNIKEESKDNIKKGENINETNLLNKTLNLNINNNINNENKEKTDKSKINPQINNKENDNKKQPFSIFSLNLNDNNNTLSSNNLNTKKNSIFDNVPPIAGAHNNLFGGISFTNSIFNTNTDNSLKTNLNTDNNKNSLFGIHQKIGSNNNLVNNVEPIKLGNSFNVNNLNNNNNNISSFGVLGQNNNNSPFLNFNSNQNSTGNNFFNNNSNNNMFNQNNNNSKIDNNNYFT